jgi:hypothetical protein
VRPATAKVVTDTNTPTTIKNADAVLIFIVISFVFNSDGGLGRLIVKHYTGVMIS